MNLHLCTDDIEQIIWKRRLHLPVRYYINTMLTYTILYIHTLSISSSMSSLSGFSNSTEITSFCLQWPFIAFSFNQSIWRIVSDILRPSKWTHHHNCSCWPLILLKVYMNSSKFKSCILEV